MGMLDRWRGESPRQLLGSWGSLTRDFDRMFQEMERTFGPLAKTNGDSYGFCPTCEVDETDSRYLVKLDVPGIAKEDIDIEVSGNEVQVSGERKREHEEKSKGFYRSEREYGSFFRSFTLPQGCKAEDIEASYDKGVLQLAIPKTEKTAFKKIPVKETTESLKEASGKKVEISKKALTK